MGNKGRTKVNVVGAHSLSFTGIRNLHRNKRVSRPHNLIPCIHDATGYNIKGKPKIIYEFWFTADIILLQHPVSQTFFMRI